MNFLPNGGPPMPPMICQMAQQQMPQFNLQQFKQYAVTLNDNALERFAQQARAQGISEQDIIEGIRMIKNL